MVAVGAYSSVSLRRARTPVRMKSPVPMRAIAIRPYIPPPSPVKGRVSPVAETSAVVLVIEVPAIWVVVAPG